MTTPLRRRGSTRLSRTDTCSTADVKGDASPNRGVTRTDEQIASHDDDVHLLLAVTRGEVTVDATNRMHLRRLAREELSFAGLGAGTAVTLAPRGQRIVGFVQGELPTPMPD